MTPTDSANDIRITRLYDAPLALVWEVWTVDAHVRQWWGPRGFSITTHSKDLRVGGTWVYTMHGPDGVDYPNYTRYLEVEPQQRLVYDHGASSADAAPMFRVTATFREVDGQTELDIRMTLPTPEAAQQTRVFIKAAGGNATWDRLGEHLEQTANGRALFVINRSFNAPIDTVFDMWTMPEHLVRWLPPTGFDMTYMRADIRVGGRSFFSMSNGEMTMYAVSEYRVIERPSRVEYVHWFADANEQLSRHPGAPTWPDKMVQSILLVAEGEKQTRVTIRTEVLGDATAEQQAAFADARGGMTMGWTGSFDALETLLAEGARKH